MMSEHSLKPMEPRLPAVSAAIATVVKPMAELRAADWHTALELRGSG